MKLMGYTCINMKNSSIQILKINSIGELQKNLINSTNSGYFVFCTSGSGTFTIDNYKVEIKKDSVINIIANSNIEVINNNQLINVIIIKYSLNILEILSTHSLIIFCPVTGATQINLTSSILGNIRN